MKTPLIIAVGRGWAATSPLNYTLQLTNRCSHGGLLKEDHLLSHIYDPKAWKWREPWYKTLKAAKYTPTRDRVIGYLGKYGFHHNTEEIEEYYKKPTLETYIKYYTRHYQRVKHEYKYVSDFSNSNAFLPQHFWMKIAPELKRHFRIKVLMIVRDPVRRLYSELSHIYQNSKSRQRKYPTSKDYFRSYLKKEKITLNSDYIRGFKSVNSTFSTMTIVSEELWGGKNNALQNLSKFLDFDIKNLYPNCYYPEMGTKAPRDPELKDQWSSDLEDLTEEDIQFGRKHLKKYYEDWYKCFGSMPWM